MNKFIKIFLIFFCIIFLKNSQSVSSENEIKLGLLIPLTGENKKLGQLIIKSTKMALDDIGNKNITVYPKDTGSDPTATFESAIKLKEMGVKIIIGPIFYKNLIYLEELKDVIFLSFTNKTIDVPKNVISTGVNATSQLNTIKKFIKLNDVAKPIFLLPKSQYEEEIEKAINNSKIKLFKKYRYNTEPTQLTKQIEKITNYKIRKQNLVDEIERVKESNLEDKEKQIEKLEKKYTIGNVNFDSVIISDFDESLKSVITSLLYVDVSPKNKYIITLNQWFDESLLNENTIQPIYYPSIDEENLRKFENKFKKKFNVNPNYLSLLSYDLVGLVYYLTLKNSDLQINKIFKKENSFKGKIGTFDIKNNKINHRLNFYKVENKEIIKIF